MRVLKSLSTQYNDGYLEIPVLALLLATFRIASPPARGSSYVCMNLGNATKAVARDHNIYRLVERRSIYL